jgi:hypothetical protein
MRYVILFFGLMLCLGSASATDFPSANEMLPGCRAYVNGATDSQQTEPCVGVVNGEIYDPVACKPEGVTADQIIRVVVQYMDSRPARLNEDFYDFMLEAVRKTWPCKH